MQCIMRVLAYGASPVSAAAAFERMALGSSSFVGFFLYICVTYIGFQ